MLTGSMLALSPPVRRRLLSVLAVLVLLLQPLALLHGLSHGLTHGHAHSPAGLPGSHATAVMAETHADAADAASALDEANCLHCLALNALGHVLPPVPLVATLLPLAQPLPRPVPLPRGGGTAAGYHARGPPILG